MNAFKILGAVAVVASLAFTTLDGEPDALRKRKFLAQAVEYKDGKPYSKKPAEDKIEFTKKGAVYSSYLAEKTDFIADYKYEITKDSTYSEEGEEKHYIEAQVITTNEEKKETLNMQMKVKGSDIEVTYKIIKKELVKKHYVSTGKEEIKEKKKKKDKE